MHLWFTFGILCGPVLGALDPVGHHPCVQFLEEGLEFTQIALALLPLLLLALTLSFLVYTTEPQMSVVIVLFDPGHPGPLVSAWVGPGVVWGKEHGDRGPVVVDRSVEPTTSGPRRACGRTGPCARTGQH